MVAINHVLCPVDFSDTSRLALDHALALTKLYHARVSVLHVHQRARATHAPSSGTPETSQAPTIASHLEREQQQATLAEYVATDRAAGVAIDTLLAEAMGVPETILLQGGLSGADLIAMGARGRSGAQGVALGSVTEHVLWHADCPVLTVPPRGPGHGIHELPPMQCVLCPVDFSASSLRALDYAASLAEAAQTRLTVLHVLELPPDGSDGPTPGRTDYRASRFEQARASLVDAIRTAVPAACVATEIVLAGKAYREILHVAADQGADLIVMGIEGRGAIALEFFGSTAHHVVRQATCPVLTVRAA